MTSREQRESRGPLELYVDHEVVAGNACVDVERHFAAQRARD
jgi:hypothetical protein